MLYRVLVVVVASGLLHCRGGFERIQSSTGKDADVVLTTGTAYLLWGTPMMTNRCSTPISVVLQEELSIPTTIQLTDSGNGQFFLDPACTVPTTDISMDAGETVAHVFYRNPVAEIAILAASTDEASTEFFSGISANLVTSPGRSHSCAILANGQVQCWGGNTHGQLGDGTTQTQLQPTNIASTEPIRWVEGGTSHSCFLGGGGQVWCVGSNLFDQLGNGSNSTSSETTLTLVVGVSNAVALSVGANGYHGCAVVNDGTVRCWGSGTYGKLGNGDTEGQNASVLVEGLEHAVAISVGERHSCALVQGGTVWCWGNNIYGQLLGDGIVSESHVPAQVPGLQEIVHIRAGSDGTCAINVHGRAFCWGSDNYRGMTELDDISDAMAIGHGRNVQCILQRTGGVQCGGSSNSNGDGQLGRGYFSGTNNQLAPITGLGSVTHLSYGYSHGCVSDAAGGIQCWGTNIRGALGNGRSTNIYTPVPAATTPPLDTGLQALALGGGVNVVRHACAVAGDGQVLCWGGNNAGQLGNGAIGVDALSATPVVAQTSGPATDVRTGHGQTCALLTNETVECWGSAGIGSNDRELPTTIPGVNSAVQIATGKSFGCALTRGQEAYCWGDNTDGELGIGNNVDQQTPVLFGLGSLDPVVEIATGFTHMCVRSNMQEVFCSGSNNSGQLGNNSTVPSNAPVQVVGLTQVTALAAGDDFTCAVLSDQTVQCWGENNGKRLGVSGMSHSPIPIPNPDLSQVLSVSAGRYHACALIDAGVDQTVSCWGSNNFGQLGIGTPGSSFLPTTVVGVSDARELRIGVEASCVILRATGSARCWGNNSMGQLGLGYFGNAPSPESVVGFSP